MRFKFLFSTGMTVLTFVSIGCTAKPSLEAAKSRSTDSHATASGNQEANAEIAKERAKLSPEDRALVEAQEWCVVSSEERLGSMGAPIKLDIEGQPVFICCKGCQKKALADPAKTLATLRELKAKKKEQPAKP